MASSRSKEATPGVVLATTALYLAPASSLDLAPCDQGAFRDESSLSVVVPFPADKPSGPVKTSNAKTKSSHINPAGFLENPSPSPTRHGRRTNVRLPGQARAKQRLGDCNARGRLFRLLRATAFVNKQSILTGASPEAANPPLQLCLPPRSKEAPPGGAFGRSGKPNPSGRQVQVRNADIWKLRSASGSLSQSPSSRLARLAKSPKRKAPAKRNLIVGQRPNSQA